MIRGFVAYLLALVLTVTGFSLAQARGGAPVTTAYVDGIEMVICTGIGMTTITIGPDGEPIETQHVCPDGAQNFVAGFDIPAMDAPEGRLLALSPVVTALSVTDRAETSPSARGPPALI
ncbi:hypothetical protein XMM379_002148 [Aliiroseovarius sp. xm-m-379]|uniref:Secreted protein n=1 Tax=Aliiroseovarius crassostreae TaxID=154981 RepID=A0A9Q9H8C6_9RHOB|nr:MULTISPECIES: hypothetical protein [Aliiroseovarius]NRP13905.1 hypothetical protein [Aliiroseovarius sp. xm-d-517]NRP25450.1 hypothetical protein [Aliiroseovarius sp. xm-m-379]NRP29442.1 hypothetical protein [Aliiroseovarius sp. xm-m-314]NRP34249.1 hypothetical protein [Aliiroseovarius sp. xm-a-104]NRP41792.1 hypothetical protein [Aliiroseovarius sp. xm-m-339-2]